MESGEVEALARERLGAAIQAVTLLRASGDGAGDLRVWSVLAEHGTFWLVEGPAGPELLRPRGANTAANVADAVGRYRALHPEAAIPAPRPGRAVAVVTYTCRVCGAAATAARPTARTERGLCRRCDHAASMRRRYREDPEFRARKLAYDAARRPGRAQR